MDRAWSRGEQKNQKTKKTEKTGKKITEKTEPKKNRINRLKNYKKTGSIRFSKSKTDWTEPNRTGSTRPPLKNKTSINRKFPNPKPTFSRPPSLPSFALCLYISPLPSFALYISASPPFLCSLHLALISPLLFFFMLSSTIVTH
jgi:hypothetical protein